MRGLPGAFCARITVLSDVYRGGAGGCCGVWRRMSGKTERKDCSRISNNQTAGGGSRNSFSPPASCQGKVRRILCCSRWGCQRYLRSNRPIGSAAGRSRRSAELQPLLLTQGPATGPRGRGNITRAVVTSLLQPTTWMRVNTGSQGRRASGNFRERVSIMANRRYCQCFPSNVIFVDEEIHIP